MIGWGLSSGSQTSCVLTWRRAREFSQDSSIRPRILFMRARPLTPNHLSRAPPLNTITLSVRFSFFVLIFIFIAFFPLSFSPLMPPPHNNHHIVAMSMSPFSFLLNPSTSYAPHLTYHPALYESVPIFLISSVCLLDSTYERNYMVFVFLWLAYFT